MTTGAETRQSQIAHLNEAQRDDALIGDLAAEAAEHLAACAACQQQVAETRMPIESFKAVTLAWSERRSATMPVSLGERALQGAAGSRRVWGSAIAALLAVMVAVPFGMRRSSEGSETKTAQAEGATGGVSRQRPQGTAGAEQTADSRLANDTIASDNIANDNQMLSEIDRELESNTARSAAMALQDVQAQAYRPDAGQAIQD